MPIYQAEINGKTYKIEADSPQDAAAKAKRVAPKLGRQPSAPQEPKQGYLESIAQPSIDYGKRLQERAERVNRPTITEKIIPGESSFERNVLAAPERAVRMAGGAVESLGEIAIGGLATADRALGSIPSKAIKGAAGFLKNVVSTPEDRRKISNAVQLAVDKYQSLPQEIKDTAAPAASLLSALPVARAAKDGLGKLRSAKNISEGSTESAAKRYISEGVGIPQDVLERASTKQGKQTLKAAGKELRDGGAIELASEVAEARASLLAKTSDVLDNQIAQLNKQADDLAAQMTTGVRGQSEAGVSIVESLTEARKKAGQRFGKTEQQYLGNDMGKQPVNFTWKESLSKATNVYEDRISRIIKNTGIEEGRIPNIAGHPLDAGEIKALENVLQEAGKVRTVQDGLVLLRKVRDMYGQKMPGTDKFYNSRVIGEIDAAVKSGFEKSLREAAKNTNVAEDLVKLYRQNNAEFKNSIRAIQDIERGASIKSLSPGNYADNIQRLGEKRLMEIKKLASKDQAIATAWKDIENGAVDSLLSRGIMPDGSFNTKAVRSALNSMFKKDRNAAIVIFGQKRIDDIMAGLDTIDSLHAHSGELGKLKGKTARELSKSGASALPERVSKITSETTASRETLEELRALDTIFGNDPESGFAQKAIDMAQAKTMGYDKPGSQLFPAIKTGIGVSGSVMGSVVGFAAGGGVMIPIMALLGHTAQSPTGAVLAYQILNSGSLKFAQNATRSALGAGVVIGSGGAVADAVNRKK